MYILQNVFLKYNKRTAAGEPTALYRQPAFIKIGNTKEARI
jgi:hypothetical protein